MADTDQQTNIEDIDEGSSLNKKIEELDKNDLQYQSKREQLLGMLTELEKQLKKMQTQIKKQQAEVNAARKLLIGYAKENPDNEEINELLNKVSADNKFLTRAVAEIIAVRGYNKNELLRLKSSQEFHEPLSAQIITDVKIKPLPSSKTNQRKEQIKEAGNKKNPKKKKKEPMSLGQKILALRTSLPNRTTASRPSSSRQKSR